MIELLFSVVGAEAGLVVLLLVRTPLRRFVLLGLDKIKRGRGPVAVRTIAPTVFIVFPREGEEGFVGLNPTDQVLWMRHLLEASLMGFSLFLALIIDRMHHYIRELRVLRKGEEAARKRSRKEESGDQDVARLKAKIAELESELAAQLTKPETAAAAKKRS
ncbi:unnamed protein product [Spirodela intermedia]|uniref:Endoplasmic reticulum transmembrane protein n=1 Tax=Spirodela intermedia TaxID=51605 RepID=A0A7I8JND5_SPIIN|nr:unnamed protein product [Spirodela intermedia]CAA6671301.1 unnamed protein product [Spirodela intermedia]